jgi:two-component system cell cycle sensor histidine kinase PleC
MYWLHFTREFYRATTPVASTHATAPVAPAAISAETPSPILAPLELVRAAPTAPSEAMSAASIEAIAADCLAVMDERIAELEAQLALSDRGRSAFLSAMSHELRTPLNAIMGFSQMMKLGVLGPIDNPAYQEYAANIHEAGELLLQKVNDLLDIASMDAGGIVLEEEDFYLRDLLAEALEIHSHDAFSADKKLHIDCAADIRLHADRRKLLCAVSHFLSNAMRHSAAGSEITMMVRIQPDDGVIISVRDHGEGIAPSQLASIREVLQKDSAYRHIEGGGIGLGLSLSKELASQHGGRLMLDSMRHRGTVISLILPKERILAGMPAKRRRSGF